MAFVHKDTILYMMYYELKENSATDSSFKCDY